jgi:citrate lyase beta subunit
LCANAAVSYIEMMKPLICLVVFFVNISALNAFQADIIDNLSTHFKGGNAKEIAANFSPSVDLIIIDEEDVYSKAQAEQILRSFFSKFPPVKSTVIHRLNTNPNYRYGALSLLTKNGTFRVSITMKKTGSTFFITELRIETEK